MTAEIQFNVDAALAKLGDLVAKHGPDALQMAAQVTQANAVGSLVQSGLTAAVGIAFWAAASRLFGPVRKAWNFEDGYESEALAVGGGISVFLLGAAAIVIGAIGFFGLIDTWSWIGAFNPKLALAHQILAKVAGQ